MINFAGENAYYHCMKCGIELVGKEVGVVDVGVNYANGEFAPCPNCTNENLIDRDDTDDHWEDNNLEKPTEIIVCAANRYGDLIICGARHHDKIMNTVLSALRANDVELARIGEQGFINQFGEFRTREEAMEVVLANCQPIDLIRNGGNGKKLFSEGLY